MNSKTETNIPKNEVDVNLFINRLLKSKKIIASITILFTLIAAIYSIAKAPEFKSTGLIEIGQYNLFFDNDAKLAKIARISKIYTDSESLDTLIESPRILIDDLRIQFIQKYQHTSSVNSLSFIPAENSLIKVIVSSNSLKDSEDFVYKISSYVEEKHEDTTNNLDQIIKQKILNEITFAETSLNHNIHTLNLQRQAHLRIYISDKKALTKKIEKISSDRKSIAKKVKLLENLSSSSNERIDQQIKLIDLELILLDLSNRIQQTELELSKIDIKIIELKAAEGSNNSNLIEEDNRFGYEAKIPELIIKDSLLLDKHRKNLNLLDSRLKTKSKLVRMDTSKNETFIFYTIFGFIFGLALSFAIVITFHSLRTLKSSS